MLGVYDTFTKKLTQTQIKLATGARCIQSRTGLYAYEPFYVKKGGVWSFWRDLEKEVVSKEEKAPPIFSIRGYVSLASVGNEYVFALGGCD